MPLVAYDPSDDDEDSQGEEKIDSVISVTGKGDPQKQIVNQLAGSSKSDELVTSQPSSSNGGKRKINEDDDVFGDEDIEELPPSRFPEFAMLPEADKKLPLPVSVTTSLSDIVVVDKKSKKVKVVIPSLDELDCDSEEEEEVGPKKKITPAGGCSLTSFLPKPKNASFKCTSSLFSTPSTSSASTNVKSSVASLIPLSISRPKTNIPPSKKPRNNPVKPDDDDDETSHSNDFFSLGGAVHSTKSLDTNIDAIIPIVKPKPEADFTPNEINEDRDPPYVNNPNTSTPSSSYTHLQSESYKHPQATNVNDPEFKKFIASKFGDEPTEKMDIVEVNVGSYLAGSHELIKSISMESGQSVKGPAPSALAKRKNQITYLAYQAKQRELDLKNQAANNKFTKAQTRARYGF